MAHRLPLLTQLSQLGPRPRRVLRYIGYALVAVITFVFAFQAMFPFGRVKDKIIEALADKYDVTIGSVEGGLWPGHIEFKAVSIRTRPAAADDVPSTLYLAEADVQLGLLAALRGTGAASLDAKIGSGRIRGDVAIGSSGLVVTATGEDLPSGSLPTREILGLPMSGKLRFAFHLDLPNDKLKTGKVGPDWTKADGSAELACPSGCTVGDGKSKLKAKLKNARNQAFAEGGIDFGKVVLDNLLADVEIKNGKLEVTKFELKSNDGEAHVEFLATLNQDIMQSQVTGCLRFKPAENLGNREPKTWAALSTTGGPRGPDNLFHIKLDGQLRDVRPLSHLCTNTGAPTGSDGTPRPNLTVTPELPKPATPPPAAPAPITPPATPPPGIDPAGLQHPENVAQPPAAEPPQPPQQGPGPVPPAGAPTTEPPSPPAGSAPPPTNLAPGGGAGSPGQPQTIP